MLQKVKKMLCSCQITFRDGKGPIEGVQGGASALLKPLKKVETRHYGYTGSSVNLQRYRFVALNEMGRILVTR